jgi:hypothetical protein
MNEFIPRRVIAIAFVLAVGAGAIYLGLSVSQAPDTSLGLFIGLVAAAVSFVSLFQGEEDRPFLIRLLIWALGLRWLVGLAIFYLGKQSSIGPDYATYDFFGDLLCRTWQGLVDSRWVPARMNANRSGWGMYYYVASIYYLIGRNSLAIQLLNCAYGAATCVLVYRIANLVYPSRRVARLAAMLTAFSPSMVLWSAQGLKEAPIILCLCLCTLFTLRLCRKFEALGLVSLLLSLFCLYSLRHYAFYVLFVAIAGALLFTAKKFTTVRIIQGVGLVVILGLTFAYLGADKVAQKSFDLKRIQEGRVWGAKASGSGFGGDVDITDSSEALSYLPIGLIYVLFAPFPWMIRSIGQWLTLPEMVVWWAAVPLLIRGYWIVIKEKLLDSLTLTIFTLMLTLAYALFQTNVGTVHRQRAQLFVFFFIFISIGWERWRATKRMRVAQIAYRQCKASMNMPVAISPRLIVKPD